ncbi:MAG: winged helix-turn-helix transcriptional regulator [Dysgonamonadaceae bacterium]|nr:winged helix-turn-helix transcriptional regulator [Dysgonamonadaceae bacterium]
MIALMSENPFITKAQISENIGVTVSAINQQIAKLKKQNIIRRDGADKGGSWVLLNVRKKV